MVFTGLAVYQTVSSAEFMAVLIRKRSILLLSLKFKLLPGRSKYAKAVLIALFCCITAKAQQLSFRHLGIEEGMPSNITSHACFDSTGLVWISTNDGLISYDGTRTKQYLKETHPALPVNDIGYLYCDSRNRIWICTGEGLAMMDEQRRIRKVTISDSLKGRNVEYCIEAPGVGIIAIVGKRSYLLPEDKTNWEPYKWFDESVRKGSGIARLKAFGNNAYMFIMGKHVMLVDFRAKKIMGDVLIENTVAISRINDHELMAADADSFKLYRIDILKGAIIKKYTDIRDIDGVHIEAAITSCETAANGTVYISTRSGGLVAFDPAHEIFKRYPHDPLSRSSISLDNLRRVYCHPNGYLLITSIKGVNFTNVLTPTLQQINTFIDDRGHITDGVSAVAEDAKGRLWIRSFDNLLMLDRKTNKVKNISPSQVALNISETNPGLGGIFRDSKNNMWVAYGGKGLCKFDEDGRLLSFLTQKDKKIPTNRIRSMYQLSGSRMMLASDDGMFIINTVTMVLDTLGDHPLLKPLLKKRIVNIMVDGDKIWIAVSPNGAAYCYDLLAKTMRTITEKDGLSSDRVYCFGKDLHGNIYIGTYDGLNIVGTDGKISVINKKNGLRHPRVENIVTDQQGRIWFTNFNCLVCYDPANKSFVYFDEQNGVSNSGFSLGQSTVTRDGRIIFCNDALLITDTSLAVVRKDFVPQVSINRLYDDGGYDLLKPSSPVKLHYDEAKISLYYLTNTLITANRFFFRYKMDGLDTGWQQPTKDNQVTYNLKPGKYVFHIQASSNEADWQQSESSITIIVLPPWWSTWWFWSLTILLFAVLLYLLYRRRIRSIKTKAAIRQQITELEAKALRAQMNPHFIFNSLNAIQELVITNKTEEGYRYLSSFSKLLRMVLNNSEKNFIPLSSELEMIQLYLSLESLRFRQSFSYEIIMDEKMEPEMINVPPLLLQPYVENAVWHGLRHKEGEKKISINIVESGNQLKIEIDDNGIGREKAAAIKKQKLGAEQFESKGTELAQQRIELINQQYPQMATADIIDKMDETGQAAGTKVVISLPSNIQIN